MGFFKIPYLTTAERTGYTPDAHELLYDTDTNTLFYGNGVATGGIELVGTANLETLAQVLAAGNNTGGTNIVIDDGDSIYSQDNQSGIDFPDMLGTAARILSANHIHLESTNVKVGLASSQRATIELYNDANTNFVALKSGDTVADLTLTLPIQDGSSGDTLITDGSGNLSFAPIPTPQQFVINEDLTSQIDGSNQSFTVVNNYLSGSLMVFADGVKQYNPTWISETSANTFDLLFTTPLQVGQTLEICYLKA